MLKKVYNFIFPSVFFLCFILSFLFEDQRKIVLTLSIIAFITAAIILLFYLFILVDEKISFPIIFVGMLMGFFGSGKYGFEVYRNQDGNTSQVLFDILIVIILVLSFLKAYLAPSKTKTTRRSFIADLLIYALIFFLLFMGGEKYYNYAFDLSEEKHATLIVEKQIDQGHSLNRSGYIFIEYKVKPNDLKIETIDISDQTKLSPGDKVEITYRNGVNTLLYTTEYDVNMWVPAPIFSDD